MSENPKRKIEAEMLVAVSAIFISVCAIGVSLYEASIMRAEQRASVLPIVELGRSYFADSTEADAVLRLELHAENVGIGPAVVRDFHVTVDGKPYPTWGAAMQAMLGEARTINYGQSTIKGRTLPAERNVVMFSLRNTELTRELLEEFERLDFEACFCSVFDECWTTSYSAGFGLADPVLACEPDQHSFTE
jgi:hypothetical protein